MDGDETCFIAQESYLRFSFGGGLGVIYKGGIGNGHKDIDRVAVIGIENLAVCTQPGGEAAGKFIGIGNGVEGDGLFAGYGCFVNGFLNDAAIGAYQSAGTELDSAEVPYDAGAHLIEIGVDEAFEHGTSRGSGRFAIVAGVGQGADAVGGTYMGGVGKFSADGCDIPARFLFVFAWRKAGDETRFFNCGFGSIFFFQTHTVILAERAGV